MGVLVELFDLRIFLVELLGGEVWGYENVERFGKLCVFFEDLEVFLGCKAMGLVSGRGKIGN